MNRKHIIFYLLSFLLVSSGLTAQSDSLVLVPSADNTIYSENDNSNSLGTQLFAGATNQGNARRALIKFDLTGIPSNATILSAELQILPNKGGSGTVTVHRLTRDWAEGSSRGTGSQGQGTGSSTGDATWNFSFFNTQSWTNPGGDFDALSSAGSDLSDGVLASLATADITADVQAWVADSTQNFGWILIGNEATTNSAMRFNSREGADSPTLTIRYETTTRLDVLPKPSLSITLSPNPTKEDLTISWLLLEKSEKLALDIHTVYGQLVRHQSLMPQSNGQQSISVQDLPSGWYILTLRNEKGFRSVRFSKQ